MTLPPWAPGATQTAVAALAVAAGQRARVMIIEDDVLVARSFQRNLPRDCDVTVHHDARDALEALLLGDTKVDLILCDLMMPGMSGQAFFEELSTLAAPLCSKFAFVPAAPSPRSHATSS